MYYNQLGDDYFVLKDDINVQILLGKIYFTYGFTENGYVVNFPIETIWWGYLMGIIEEFSSLMNHIYNKRGAIDAKKDIAYGKLGEVVAYAFLRDYQNFPSYCTPDFSVLPVSKKSWKPDLDAREFGSHFSVHVKSTDEQSYRRDGVASSTWVFNIADKPGARTGRDRIFDGPGDDFVVFVYVPGVASKRGYIKSVVRWDIVYKDKKNTMLVDPFKKSFVGMKLTIWHKQIVDQWKISKNGIWLPEAFLC